MRKWGVHPQTRRNGVSFVPRPWRETLVPASQAEKLLSLDTKGRTHVPVRRRFPGAIEILENSP